MYCSGGSYSLIFNIYYLLPCQKTQQLFASCELEAGLHAFVVADELADGTEGAGTASLAADGTNEFHGLGAVEGEAHLVATDRDVCGKGVAIGRGELDGLLLGIEGVGAGVAAATDGISHLAIAGEGELYLASLKTSHAVDGY